MINAWHCRVSFSSVRWLDDMITEDTFSAYFTQSEEWKQTKEMFAMLLQNYSSVLDSYIHKQHI